MTKNNYLAWKINPSDFKKDWSSARKLEFFARFAILAPSGHNTQPWQIAISEDSLTLQADPERKLAYSGTRAAEPQISIGSFLEALKLAAQGFGHNLAIRYVLGTNLSVQVRVAGTTKSDAPLVRAILNRSSNRNFYDRKPLSDKLLASFTQYVFDDVSAHILIDRKDISFIAKQTSIATVNIMKDKEMRLELSKWVRNNHTNQYDGMPGYCQGIPTPTSMLASHVIKYVDVSGTQAKKDSDRVIHSANLIMLTVKDKNDTSLINVGRAYTHTCITARQQDVSTSGVGAAVIDDRTREQIVSRFNLSETPVAIIRLGRTDKKVRHLPRRTFEMILSS